MPPFIKSLHIPFYLHHQLALFALARYGGEYEPSESAGGDYVKSHIVYRLCNHMVYTLSLIQPGVIVQEIALFECVNSLVQVDAADSELPEH